VSSRNQANITSLQDDVNDMKTKKVDLQKLLHKERKDHANELKKLQKSAIQKDRELHKWKKLSADREGEARRVNQVAKARLGELGQLRTKYKDAEKRLRLLSVKRGVMAKAGLDPVMVGRRTSPRSLIGRKGRTAEMQTQSNAPTLDADSLRDYFDAKVSEVGRKEATVDKLAHEWEDHFELSSRREQLSDTLDNETYKESCEALDVQIKFKEDRIRQLVSRLGSTMNGAKTKDDDVVLRNEYFLNDEKFAIIVEGTHCTSVWVV
jgi:hypothetical protein